ncbi:hypothetical protein llap_14937 [Limosa lapponica baueri]|uniref:BCAS3 WD40 domain-containing protein n=1 Tax=Limosa lapponica baueri TaxID=1758121 RepID=A0A2I0TLS5_LIMLA|nr:hypothetical protein llap_14937 [Limosa lapponica baueri]
MVQFELHGFYQLHKSELKLKQCAQKCDNFSEKRPLLGVCKSIGSSGHLLTYFGDYAGNGMKYCSCQHVAETAGNGRPILSAAMAVKDLFGDLEMQ